MRKRSLVLGLLLVVVAGGAGLTMQHIVRTRQPAPVAPPPPAIPVVAAAVMSHEVPIYLQGVGTVIAYNNVVVRSQITGQITSINYIQGQTVHTGDLLAQIDPRPYQAQLDQATANRDRDQAQLVNAQANLARYSPLAAKGYATSQLVDTQKAQIAQLQSMIKSDEAVIENAKINLGYTRLTAPIDGVTGIRQVDVGNIIHPTDPAGLVDLTQIQPISVLFTLPEQSFIQIQQQMGKGPLAVMAFSLDGTTELDQGKLDLIDNQIVQTTGTIRLRAEFPNAQKRLWPGELINARLLIDTRPNGLTIAASAVQQGPNGPYVYAIDSDGNAQMRAVKISQITAGQALVDSGLAANESIVIDGQYKLQPGAHVVVLHGNAAQQVSQQSAVEQEIP
jgi:multidrug efflux system membrane fusion protein